MGSRFIKKCWGAAFALLLGLMAQPALAQPITIENACSASGSDSQALGDFIAAAQTWNCPADTESLSENRTVLRFALAGQDVEALTHLVSHSATLSRLSLLAVDRDGSARQLDFGYDDLKPELLNRRFSVPLPSLNDQSEYLYVAIENTNQALIMDYVELTDVLPGTSAAERNELLIVAAICGILLMPLAFNFACYPVLREKFVLWHAAIAASTLTHLLAFSGLIHLIMPVPMSTLRTIIIGSFGGLVIAGCMFTIFFVEKDCLHPRARKLLFGAAILVSITTFFHAGGFQFTGRYATDLFFLSCGGVIGVLGYTLWTSLKLGSRAMKIMVIAWLPMAGLGFTRVTSHIVPGMPAVDANELFYLAVASEVLGTTFGVVGRFMEVKRERDHALGMATAMETLSEKDPLTGLLNRRAIEDRFDDLRVQGFDTMAVIDLDLFKRVNDTFGHQKGDEVLCACANALRGDGAENRDTVAVRLGGEEFMLLLQGSHTTDRAEHMRQQITLRVASDVAGLDRPVTASMGVIEIPAKGIETMRFAELYARADKLLYEAKETGRNRSVHERLSVFASGPKRARTKRNAA